MELDPVGPSVEAVVTDGCSPARQESGSNWLGKSISTLFFHSPTPLAKPPINQRARDLQLLQPIAACPQGYCARQRMVGKPWRWKARIKNNEKSPYNSELSIHPLEILPFAKLCVSSICGLWLQKSQSNIPKSISSFLAICILMRCSYADLFILFIPIVCWFYGSGNTEVIVKLNNKTSIESLLTMPGTVLDTSVWQYYNPNTE